MAKRENGEGSVYKRKDIKRRPWVVALPASYSLDEQGKMIKKRDYEKKSVNKILL